jgi:hypothetical protein
MLNWQVDSWDADSTVVWRSTDSGSIYSNLATSVGPTVLSYTDTTVTNGGTYWYKAARINVAGTSSFSNTASISFS